MPRDKAHRDLGHEATHAPSIQRLGAQLYLHEDAVFKHEVWPVRNNPAALGKPLGGFWTSSYDPNYGSGWVQWCMAYRYNDPFDLHWTVLTVSKSARVAVINSQFDLAALIERYPRTLEKLRGLDFERLAEEYAGLHLTNTGYLATRMNPSSPTLVGWDCESTVWFRWVFTRCEEVKPHFQDAEHFNRLWLSLSGWSTEDYECHRMSADKASRKVYETMLRQTLETPEKVRVALANKRRIR